jgi:alpha-galactosidase
MISADVGELPPSTVRMFTNREAIALSQDRLGKQGSPVLRRGDMQLWVKPLADGSRAVGVLNRGTTPGRISFRGSAVRLLGRSCEVRNIWSHRTFRVTGPMSFRVPATSALLLRISRA